MTRSVLLRGLALVGFAFVVSSCSLFTDNKAGTFTVSLSDAALSLFQSVKDTVTITVTRSDYDKPVVLTALGVPTGVTAVITPGTLTSPAQTALLVITASGTAAVGTTAITVNANGEGVAEQSASVDLTVGVTGNFTLGAHGAPAVAAQGGGTIATVLVVRSGGHADNVALSVSGAPAGVTATISPTSTSGGAASLTITAAAGAAVGTYPLQITGTAPGLSPQNTAFNLNVIAPPSTASFTLPFCASAIPVWFAYQNEGYGWQNVLPVGTTFTFPATAKIGVAYTYVFQDASTNQTQVRVAYASRAELANLTDLDCSGSKSVGGSVVGASSGQTTRVAMGTAVATATQASPAFTLSSVANRSLDLIATKGTISSNSGDLQVLPDMVLLRRAQNPANNTTLSPLDFGSAEAFAPVSGLLTINNGITGDLFSVVSTLRTATNSYGTLSSSQPSVSSATVYSVPAVKLVAGDVHELLVEANQQTVAAGRQVVAYLSAFTDRTETLPAALGAPSVTALGSSPYLRLREQLPVQAEFPDAARFIYRQLGSGSVATRFVFVVVTKGYLGATPASTWDLVTPDLATVTGFTSNWMPSSTVLDYQADAYGGPGGLFFGGTPIVGDYIRYAYRVESLGSLIRANAVSLRAQAQYLRR